MTYDYPQTQLSKCVMAGTFAGIAATLVNLAYDYFYREVSYFSPSTIINVASIIFASMLLLVVAGFAYFFLSKLTFGVGLYIIIFTLLTAYCFYLGMHVNRSANPLEISQFRTLLLGVEAPTGLIAAFGIPYLVKHSDIYC